MLTIPNSRVRKALRVLIPFVLIPLVVWLGVEVFDAKRYIWISFCVAALSLLLFLSGYEKKSVGTRRMVIVAIMVALSVAGRFIPLFKPITAITVITAVYLGAESGFLVGSLSALISNFYFGQGPWTPFQMLAWGLIGLFAGLLQKPLKRSRVLLLIYGVLSGIAYSMLMDVWTVGAVLDLDLYLAALVTALPHTLLYAVSNLIFLWLLAKPFGEKLERIRVKYGI